MRTVKTVIKQADLVTAGCTDILLVLSQGGSNEYQVWKMIKPLHCQDSNNKFARTLFK